MKRVCNNPHCIHKGKPQEESNFHQSKVYPHPLSTECKECLLVRSKKAYDKVVANREWFWDMFIRHGQ